MRIQIHLIGIIFTLFCSLGASANQTTWTHIRNVRILEVSCSNAGNFCYLRAHVPSSLRSRLCQNKSLFAFDGRSEGGKQLLALAMNAFNTQGNVNLVAYGLRQIQQPCHGTITKLHRINLKR